MIDNDSDNGILMNTLKKKKEIIIILSVVNVFILNDVCYKQK